MGQVIKKKLNGMSWWMKTSLVLLLTLATTIFMYQGWYKPSPAAAAVASGSWANVFTSAPGAASGTVTSSTFAAGAGANRILLVGVAVETSAVGAMTTLSATYGGVALTTLNTTAALTPARGHMYVGYLREAQIPAGNNAVIVTYNSGAATTSSIDIITATYTGIDQTTPVNASASYNAANATVANTGTAVAYVLDGLTFYAAMNGGAAATATITSTPTFTQSANMQSVNQTTSAGNTAVHTGAGSVAAAGLSIAFAGTTSTRSALVVGSFRPAAAVTAGTLAVSTAAQTVAEAVGNATVSVTRTGGTTGAVTVDYATADGTALAGQDYTSTTGTLSWAAGDATAKTITIPIINDTYDEASETFTVNLSTPTNGAVLGTATQTVTITDDDGTPTIGFTAASSTGNKLVTPATFNVSLSAVSGLPTSVYYTTANGTAVAGTDYTTTSGTLTIPALSASGTINVPISAASNGGTFTITISVPTNSTLRSGFTTHTYTITSAAASTINNCAGCHGYKAPLTFADGASRNDAGKFQGSHNTHVIGQVMNCAGCHTVPTTETTADNGHSDGKIQMAGSISGGTYTVASPITVSNTFAPGTCNGTSCHANVYGTVAIPSPTWGSSASGCAACHNTFPIGASGPATGAHATHAAEACTSCHSAGTTATTAPTANHADGSVNVAIGGYPVTAKHTANTGYTGTCTSIYCHSSGTGGTGQTGDVRALGTPKTVPTWGTTLGCNGCHGNVATDGRPEYASGTPKMNDHLVGPHLAKTCDFCHDSVTYNAGVYTPVALLHNNQTYNVKSAMGYTYNAGGGSCATSGCHGNAQWGVTVLDCISCHTSPLTIATGPLTGGTRAAVALSLKSSGTRNHKSTTVGSDATKFDCIVCHMEGDSVTGSTSAQHANGVLDFRDPDTGAQVLKVAWSGGAALGNSTGGYIQTLTNFTTARFSRNLSQTLDADPAWLKVASIQQNLCLKCHDANGAIGGVLSKTAAGASNGATALRPFGNTTVASTATTYQVTATANSAAGNTTGSVMNVSASFETTNASYHPVSGRQNNSYVSGTRMRAPWNTARTNGVTNQYGYMLSCFDCHAAPGAPGLQTSSVVAHGNGSTISTPVLISNVTVWTAGANICNNCHAGYTTSTTIHSAGSAWAVNGSNHNTGVCAQCHASAVNAVGVRAVDAHGFNVMNGGTTTTNTYGTRPYAFMRSPVNQGNWRPGTCASTSGCTTTGTYTPGGVY